VVALAELPLPDSFLFLETLAGSESIDESDLPQWDKAPPYDSPPPPDTPDEAQFTRNLADVMHGRNLRIERESCARRAHMFEMGEILALQKEVQEAEKKLVDGWDKLDECVSSMQACERHRVMAECYRQWQARMIFKYRQEVDDLLATQRNPYA